MELRKLRKTVSDEIAARERKRFANKEDEIYNKGFADGLAAVLFILDKPPPFDISKWTC